jgi:hypothetical protein
MPFLEKTYTPKDIDKSTFGWNYLRGGRKLQPLDGSEISSEFHESPHHHRFLGSVNVVNGKPKHMGIRHECKICGITGLFPLKGLREVANEGTDLSRTREKVYGKMRTVDLKVNTHT